MQILLLLILFAVLLYAINQKQDTDFSRKRYVIIMSFVMLLIAGLRNQAVGSDTYAYLMKFDDINNYSWSQLIDNIIVGFFNPAASDIGKDPAMAILNKLIAIFVTDHTLYLLITSAALLVPLGLFFYRNSTNLKQLLFSYSFFIALYFNYMPCSAIRQSIALGVLTFAYTALQNEKFKKGVALVLLAALFHKSSLIVLIFFACYKFMKPTNVYRYALLSFVFVFFFYNTLGTLLSDSGEIYEKYVNSTYYAREGQSRPFVVVLLYFIFYIIGLLKMPKDYECTSNSTNLSLIGAALTTTFIPLVRMDPTLVRISAYFVIWSCLYVPESITKYSDTIRSVIFVTCILLFAYKSLTTGFDYAFFWQDMMLHERYN